MFRFLPRSLISTYFSLQFFTLFLHFYSTNRILCIQNRIRCENYTNLPIEHNLVEFFQVVNNFSNFSMSDNNFLHRFTLTFCSIVIFQCTNSSKLFIFHDQRKKYDKKWNWLIFKKAHYYGLRNPICRLRLKMARRTLNTTEDRKKHTKIY